MNWILNQLQSMLRPHAGWLAVIAAIGLTVIGVKTIHIACPPPGVDYSAQQLRWAIVSGVALFMCVLPGSKFIRMITWPLMALAMALLVLVILPGVPRSLVPLINGATCWINLGFMNIQPSELARVAFTLVLADYLRHRASVRTFWGMLVPVGMMLPPMLLIAKEPDLGVAALLPITVLSMLLAAGARLRHIAMLLGIGVIFLILVVGAVYFDLPESMQILKPHQRARIAALISRTQSEPRPGKAVNTYQQSKAVTLVGAGQAWGYGPLKSVQVVHLNRLPEDHTDMIFPVVVCTWGFAGGATMLGLYGLLIISIFAVGARSRDAFARLTCVGFGVMFTLQVCVNVGMTVGIMPITGITLPFVSYGGASLVMSYVMIGLVFNFGCKRDVTVAPSGYSSNRAAQNQQRSQTVITRR